MNDRKRSVSVTQKCGAPWPLAHLLACTDQTATPIRTSVTSHAFGAFSSFFFPHPGAEVLRVSVRIRPRSRFC